MNDENQENEAPHGPVILLIPASVTVPGFGFLVTLNPDWCLPPTRERKSNIERLGTGVGGHLI
jgi:hypothetical protein